MLWNASAMCGYDIEASDGRLGTVSDLLFDDASWIIRWLVVDTGDWLPGRKVLLPISALGLPDCALRSFPIKLTMQQVKESPETGADQPVSRQTEISVYSHFELEPYWASSPLPLSNSIATPLVAPLYLFGSNPQDVQYLDAQPNNGDPHLRSIAAVTGLHVEAVDGEIGHVEDLLIDDVSWTIRFIKVDTKNWWPGEQVLISPRSVKTIDWPQKRVRLDVTGQKVKESPSYNPLSTVDGAYEEKFLTYYGIRWVAA